MATIKIDPATGEIIEDEFDYEKIQRTLAEVRRDLDAIGKKYGGVYRPQVQVDQRQELLAYIMKALLSGSVQGA